MPSLENPKRKPGCAGLIFLKVLQSLAERPFSSDDAGSAGPRKTKTYEDRHFEPFGVSLGTFDLKPLRKSGISYVLFLDFKSPERNIELPSYFLMKLFRVILLRSADGYDAEGGLEGKLYRYGDVLKPLKRKSCLCGTLLWVMCEVCHASPGES